MAPQHYVPPSARDLRTHAVQRLQAGLFGLSAIVLIVGLANIIKDRARLAEEGLRPTSTASAEASPSANDPLADIGVVPSALPNDAAEPARPGTPSN
ncbi:hypothetical protein [Novosphingobium kunmingense]|uniref:hypothetical protein n=1 Tax=Novosphingobium kunmingense TaxID=1211806 RepID=UPI0018E27DF3|nr:hypothetical protein [Novosphingobium kunmingense]